MPALALRLQAQRDLTAGVRQPYTQADTAVPDWTKADVGELQKRFNDCFLWDMIIPTILGCAFPP
jgi:hypothetical protein